MEEWIRATFSVVSSSRGTDGDVHDRFVFSSINGSEVSAPVAWVSNTFGPDQPMSAQDLRTKDPDDTLAWHQHFDAWVEQGILPL